MTSAISLIRQPNNVKNLSISILNILFFIVVQYLFFTLIASKQLSQVIINKVGLLNEYLKLNESEKLFLSKSKHSDETASLLTDASMEKNERLSLNTNLFKKRMLPLIIVLSILIIITFIFVYRNRNTSGGEIDFSYKLGLGLIVGAYVTELLFFFGIVKQYIFIGDHTIISNLYNGIDKKLDN